MKVRAKQPSVRTFVPTMSHFLFFLPQFLCCGIIIFFSPQLRRVAPEIRDYYLPLTLPLFHWPSTLLLSLYIFLAIMQAYSIGKFEVIKRGCCGEGERLLRREGERERERVVPGLLVAPSGPIAADQLAVFEQIRHCTREKCTS